MKLIIISSIPSPYSSIRSTKGFPHIFPSTGENMFYAQTQALGKGHYASVFYKTTLLKSVWFLELRLVGGNDFYVTYATDVAVWFSFLPAWDVIHVIRPLLQQNATCDFASSSVRSSVCNSFFSGIFHCFFLKIFIMYRTISRKKRPIFTEIMLPVKLGRNGPKRVKKWPLSFSQNIQINFFLNFLYERTIKLKSFMLLLVESFFLPKAVGEGAKTGLKMILLSL